MPAIPATTTHEPPAPRSAPVALVEESAACCLAWLPADSLERLAHHFTPAAVRRRRDAERDACYRALAAALPFTSVRKIAKAVADEISRYQTGRWRFESGRPAPPNYRRALLHRILTLDERALKPAGIRAVLSGYESTDFRSQHLQDTSGQAEPAEYPSESNESSEARDRHP